MITARLKTGLSLLEIYKSQPVIFHIAYGIAHQHDPLGGNTRVSIATKARHIVKALVWEDCFGHNLLASIVWCNVFVFKLYLRHAQAG